MALFPEEPLENAESLASATTVVARGVAMRILVRTVGRVARLPSVPVIVVPVFVSASVSTSVIVIAVPSVAANAMPVRIGVEASRTPLPETSAVLVVVFVVPLAADAVSEPVLEPMSFSHLAVFLSCLVYNLHSTHVPQTGK